MKPTVETKPVLTIDNGLCRPTAVCDSGAHYIYWEIDWLAEQYPAECEICEHQVESGWHCLDGGGVWCDDCVIDIEDVGDYIMTLERRVKALELSEAILIGQREAAYGFIRDMENQMKRFGHP